MAHSFIVLKIISFENDELKFIFHNEEYTIDTKKAILAAHGIEWRTPTSMNPGVMFE